jgi:glycosyltransferase involved in cell wall biosynthesis
MKTVSWVLFFAFSFLSAVEGKQTVCLNMIVKNERSVIERALGSAKKWVDYWVIVDTGSTDGTQEAIKAFLRDVPGELHERPWVDFAHNRNEALRLAKGKGDYLLFLDADEELQWDKSFQFPVLDKDIYLGTVRYGSHEGKRGLLLKSQLPWVWVGVLHETVDLIGSREASIGHLHGITTLARLEGCRSRDPQKFHKDAQVLEKAIQKEPANSRYIYYLAKTYWAVPNFSLALKNFEKRAALPEWNEEVYDSLCQIALLQEILGQPNETVIKSFSKAFQHRPMRAEPIYHLARCYSKEKNYLMAYIIAKFGASLPLSSEWTHVERWIYEWGLSWQMAIAASHIGQRDEALALKKKLLANPHIPPDVVAEIKKID